MSSPASLIAVELLGYAFVQAPSTVQVVHARCDDADELALVLSVYDVALDDAARAAFPSARTVFVVASTEDSADVVTIDGDLDSRRRAAAAVAVMKASYGWEEADPFEIVVDETRLIVSASFDGGVWRATVGGDRP